MTGPFEVITMHFYYLLTTQQEFVRVITYRAYNMIQARQCTIRNDLLVLIVREKGQPFLNNFGTSCISPNFLTCKHSHKEKCINELYRKATDRDFRDSYIYTPDAFGGTIEN